MKIAHISDIHYGQVGFNEGMLSRCIDEVNDLDPDMTIITGDLSMDGLKKELERVFERLKEINTEKMVIPGNHDSRNVGYLAFERLFGERYSEKIIDDIQIICCDSSEPDLDTGQIGREGQRWLKERLEKGDAKYKIIALHHHLIPIPFTGRERNVLHDAGSVLKLIYDAGVNLVLNGHKHVPHNWVMESSSGITVFCTAGSVSSDKLKADYINCYNIIDVSEDRIKIELKNVGKESTVVVDRKF
ncbi:MAG: hypothetical protein A7316_02075 [Candidatus Altiarchaeales archaeon WOR_SM1_86-2]|nr:MAG: hypothetical protein A7316_02075 [Candidatus Altiarchaeales archaeon WOR_SM1_86-2]ODS41718.1 MAG: hypothetical protein A7315_00470 [Candidatus Altiarchaeales archaeon WOR_SM1_79]